MAHRYQAIANKYAGQACRLYTLDGEKDATICGRLNKFASIAVNGEAINVEVSWPCVERKMESDKLFYAC